MVLRPALRRWVWGGPGGAWFGLDLPPAQYVGPLGAMIASFGNSTLLIRVKFPKLAIMSSWLVVLVPARTATPWWTPPRPGPTPGPADDPVRRHFATSPPAKSARDSALLLPVAIARSW